MEYSGGKIPCFAILLIKARCIFISPYVACPVCMLPSPAYGIVWLDSNRMKKTKTGRINKRYPCSKNNSFHVLFLTTASGASDFFQTPKQIPPATTAAKIIATIWDSLLNPIPNEKIAGIHCSIKLPKTLPSRMRTI